MTEGANFYFSKWTASCPCAVRLENFTLHQLADYETALLRTHSGCKAGAASPAEAAGAG